MMFAASIDVRVAHVVHQDVVTNTSPSATSTSRPSGVSRDENTKSTSPSQGIPLASSTVLQFAGVGGSARVMIRSGRSMRRASNVAKMSAVPTPPKRLPLLMLSVTMEMRFGADALAYTRSGRRLEKRSSRVSASQRCSTVEGAILLPRARPWRRKWSSALVPRDTSGLCSR